MSNFVTSEWLHSHLDDKNLIIVDCRADLFDREYGKKHYEEGHIKGAFFLDVKKDLSGEVKEHGGRSPLPDLEILRSKLEGIGISNDKAVIAYDEAKLAGAERFWWMLKYLGHEKVHVLNGGINAWIEAGYPLIKEVPSPAKGLFSINLDRDIITDIIEVKRHLGKEGFVLVDSRAPERYRGEVEPIDRKAGHIPGAKNYHWKDVLDEKGRFIPKEKLEEHFEALKNYKDIVLQCGSGIDACGNFIALDELGIKPRLYLGSFSDWVSYDENPVSTGED